MIEECHCTTLEERRKEGRTLKLGELIGASLSEPHTSVTALLDACVCMHVCMSACGHIPKNKLSEQVSNLHTC